MCSVLRFYSVCSYSFFKINIHVHVIRILGLVCVCILCACETNPSTDWNVYFDLIGDANDEDLIGDQIG